MTKQNGNEAAAVRAAKKIKSRSVDTKIIHTLSTGVRIRLQPVAVSLLETVMSEVKRPQIPTFYDDDRDRVIENPAHPDYIAALETYDRDRNMAALDAVILFGVELVDGLPSDGKWLSRLKLMNKLGTINLSGFDLDDEVDLEFVYKKFVAIGVPDNWIVSEASGISSEELDRADDMFQGDKERDTAGGAIAIE